MTKIIPKSKAKRINKRLIAEGITALILLISFIVCSGVAIHINIENGKIETTFSKSTSSLVISDEQIPAYITDDKGEVIETTTYNGMEIQTVDEVDGGQFEDIDTGVSTNESEYEDLGSVIELFDTSTPEAFRDDTYNKCIIAGNKYGAQCVSLARSFWWSYANRDVSTCGTGMAKGMMNCADQNAGDDFLVFWGSNGIQDGDWLISDGGQYGHVCMALAPVVNGYVACLGENQGGRSCEQGGSATNIINFNVKNVIGYYRPKAYIKPEPTPTPVVPSCNTRKVVAGETLGSIMKECKGEISWGEAMDEYAKNWYSNLTGKSVYYGWSHGTGYGLYADDIIEYKGN